VRRALPLLVALVISIAGSCFAVAQPQVWGADEAAHLFRAYQVSTGGWAPQRLEERGPIPRYGGQVPASFVRLADSGTARQWSKPQRGPVMGNPDARRPLLDAPVGTQTTEAEFVNTAAYAPTSYAPAVVGLWTSRLAGLDVGGTILVTRLLGVLTAAVAGALAVWLLRGTGWEYLAAVVACLPSVIFQAATVSADTMTNAVTLVLAASFVRLTLTDSPPSRAATWALALSVLLVGVAKPTYVPMALLLLVVPASRLAWGRSAIGRGPSRAVGAGVVGTSLAVSLGWLSLAAGTTAGMGVVWDPRDPTAVRPDDQRAFVLGHLPEMVRIAYRTLADSTPKYLRELFVQTGYQVEGSGGAMILVLMALALAWFLAPRPVVSRARLLIVALVVAASGALIFGALYLSFTPVGLWVVAGVQGRYFYPLLLPGLLVARAVLPLRLVEDQESRIDGSRSWERAVRRPPASTGAVGWVVGLTGAAALLAVMKYALLMLATTS